MKVLLQQRNKGLEVSRGNYIMFLDADDIIYPKHTR